MNSIKKEEPVSFVGHLSELRRRLIKSFIFLLLAFLLCYYFSSEIYSFLVKPYAEVLLENQLDRRLI